uniref:Golgin subfamily A member 7 n=2 Tax=Macaca TaxID=9539 RepID=A0A5F8AR44_MACMU
MSWVAQPTRKLQRPIKNENNPSQSAIGNQLPQVTQPGNFVPHTPARSRLPQPHSSPRLSPSGNNLRGRKAGSALAPPTAFPFLGPAPQRAASAGWLYGQRRGAGCPVLAMRPQQAPVSGKVFIQRDYSSGTRCQFQTKFPAELENRIDRQQFEETVRTLNNLYAEAEKLGGQSYLEGCLACLTAYTIFLCMETHYEKVLKKVSKYIQEQNEKIYAPQGLLLTDPIERGLRVVSFWFGSESLNIYNKKMLILFGIG